MIRAEHADCPRCSRTDQLLYRLEPTDVSETSELACAECCRAYAHTVHRTTPCDTCGASGAWRNPYTRRNEYFCAKHHAESGDGVVLNKWFPRASAPLGHRDRPKCSAAGASDCRGEVRPRSPLAELLCTKHAGRVSAAWAVEDGLV